MNVQIHGNQFKSLALSLCSGLLCLSLVACAGRTANPIAVKEVGDKEMTCENILSEMNDLDRLSRRLLGEQSSKASKNAALGVAGFFLLFPWIFMDLGDAEQQEAYAMQDRYRHLERISRKNSCE